MKKLVIISTDFQSGHGGMQSALSGYVDGLNKLGVEYVFIESHNESDTFSLKWASAFVKIIGLLFKHKPSELVFWFHCGPWLSFLRKFSLSLVPRLTGAKVIAHLHSYSLKRYLDHSISALFIKLFLLPFNEIVVLNHWWKNFLISKNITKNITISHNPVTGELVEQAGRADTVHTEFQEDIRIISMGRLMPGKGFESLIEAMTLLPTNYTLIIAGDGVLKKHLEENINKFNLNDRVSLTGWITGKDKDDLLKKSSMFCLPSSNDAFGMIYIEAMAYGLPVVALDFPPVRSLISSTVGVLCEDSTPASIKSAIEKVSIDLGQYCGGPKAVIENFSPEKSAQNIVNYLK